MSFARGARTRSGRLYRLAEAQAAKRQRTAAGTGRQPLPLASAPPPPTEEPMVFACRHDVDALLNKKIKGKSKMDYKLGVRSCATVPTLASSSTASCSPPEGIQNHPSKRAKTSTEMANNRANWAEATTKTFLNLCIAEKNLQNFNSRGLTKIGWQNLYRNFRQQTGLRYDNKQLQKKLAQMRRTYMQWRDLQHNTGLGRNRNNGGVAADDSYWGTEEGDTSDAEPTCGNPPPFLEELEVLFGRNTQDRGVLLSAGGVRATNVGFDTPQHTLNDPFDQSNDRSRSKRPIREQTVDSRPEKKSASIEECLKECLRYISEAMIRRSRKSNNYDVAEHR